MVSFRQFVEEAANFNVGASSRPELARFMNRGRNVAQQTQTYPLQTQTASYPPLRSSQPSRQTQPSASINGTGQQPQQAALSRQPVAPAITQRNVATTTYPVQTTAPTQQQQTATGRNGQLTQQELKPVGKYNAGPSGKRQWYADNAFLNPKAADSFLAAQQAYGRPFPINSAYRNLEHQKGLSGEGHKVVGRAGTSRHGLGMAVDIQPNTPHYNWFKQNGPKFGWYFAAIPGDPYHFEFRG